MKHPPGHPCRRDGTYRPGISLCDHQPSPPDPGQSECIIVQEHRSTLTEAVLGQLLSDTTDGNIYCMGKKRRGNYIFLTWKGDHSPRHVHVYRDAKLVVKWDLEHWQPMAGKANCRILQIIEELNNEGEL